MLPTDHTFLGPADAAAAFLATTGTPPVVPTHAVPTHAVGPGATSAAHSPGPSGNVEVSSAREPGAVVCPEHRGRIAVACLA